MTYQNYIRSMPIKSSNNLLTTVDGEIQRNATNVVNVTETLFLSDTVRSGVCSGILRSPNYLYYFNGTATFISITEYKLSDGTTTTIRAHTGTETNPQYSIVDERKVAVMGPGSDASHVGLYLVDFSLGTSTQIVDYLFDFNEGNIRHFLAFYGSGYLQSTVYGGKTYSIMSGLYNYVNSDTDAQNEGVCFLVYNHTDNTTTVTYECHIDDESKSSTNFGFDLSPTIFNGKIVAIPDIDPDYTAAYVAFHILDLSDMSHTVVRYDLIDDSDMDIMSIAPDINNNSVFVSISEYNGFWPYDLLKLNLTSNTISLIAESDEDYWDFCVGSTETYIYNWNDGTWCDTSLNSLLAFTPPSNGFSPGDNLSYAFDDVERRIWYYDSTGPKLVGLRITDGDEREITLTVTYPTISPRAMVVLHLGNMFVIVKMKVTATKTDYYLLRDLSGEIPATTANFQVIWFNGAQ